MANIHFFYGSNKDFRSMIKQCHLEDPVSFMELVRQYNATVRANDVMGNGDPNFEVNHIENVVIFADDFSSVLNHVISNFSNIILLGHKIENLYIQNPPKRVIASIHSHFGTDEISTNYAPYFEPSTENIIDLYSSLQGDNNVIGQEKAKKESCVALFKSAYREQNKPTVLMFYGPSGVGKTELAKSISNFYHGKLTRIQFSMMQTEEAYKYVFGDTHSTPSMAKDLLARETNVVLIDEFDKCSPGLYNVFYQMFDEGVFEDMNYRVDVSNCTFILTSNFNDEKSIASTVGMPVYSRIDKKVKFEKLSDGEVELVINKIFKHILSILRVEDVKIIKDSFLQERYINNLGSFTNIRMLDKFIENDVYTLLMDSRLTDPE